MPCLQAENSLLLTLACISKIEANKQTPVVQTLHSAINRINHYPVDKYYGNQLRYPVDSDLSGGYCYPAFEQLGPEH